MNRFNKIKQFNNKPKKNKYKVAMKIKEHLIFNLFKVLKFLSLLQVFSNNLIIFNLLGS